MEKLIVISVITGFCWAGEPGLSNRQLTLGEIHVGHHEEGDLSLTKLGGSEHPIDLERYQGVEGGGEGHFISDVKGIGIPVAKNVPFLVSSLQIQSVPQNYPIPVFVRKPVPYPVEKQIFSKVEKKVSIPVEKVIPVKVEKLVPFTVVKHVPVPLPKPIPIKIPIYKTIIHRHKGH